MEVNAGVPQAEMAEMRSPKRKVIRVEPVETQDNCVCEMLSISPEEAEELAFVPSAISEPRGAFYFCDNRCSEKAIRYWQFASVVVEEGGEARTVNLCQQCYNERQAQQGEPRLNSWQRRAVVEKEAHRGRIWRIMGNEQFTEYFPGAGRNEDMGRSSEILRKGYFETRDSRWEEFKEECMEKGMSSESALGAIREAYEKVVKEEAGRVGIVRETLRKVRMS